AQAGGFFAGPGVPSTSLLFRILAPTCDSFHPNDPNNSNVSEFCDPDIDHRFAKAVALQVSDPAAARDAWSELDRKLVDLAPFIPGGVPERADLLWERGGTT